MINVTESAFFQNITATTAAFGLKGGIYAYAYAAANWSGQSATLQQLGADGSSWLNAVGAASANGISAPLFLGPGQYRVALANSAAVSVVVAAVPA